MSRESGSTQLDDSVEKPPRHPLHRLPNELQGLRSATAISLVCKVVECVEIVRIRCCRRRARFLTRPEKIMDLRSFVAQAGAGRHPKTMP